MDRDCNLVGRGDRSCVGVDKAGEIFIHSSNKTILSWKKQNQITIRYFRRAFF